MGKGKARSGGGQREKLSHDAVSRKTPVELRELWSWEGPSALSQVGALDKGVLFSQNNS